MNIDKYDPYNTTMLRMLNERKRFLTSFITKNEQNAQIEKLEKTIRDFSWDLSIQSIERGVYSKDWLLFAGDFLDLAEKYLPSFPKKVLQKLKEVVNNLKFTSSLSFAEIKTKLKQLKQDEEFSFLLDHQTNEDKIVENVVVIKKRGDGFDVTLFDPGSNKEHLVESALGHERAYPFLYFKGIPEAELLEADGYFIDRLAQASLKASLDSSYVVAAFKPFEAYQSSSPEWTPRLINTAKTHPLKGLNAYLYSEIAKVLPNENALNILKIARTLFLFAEICLTWHGISQKKVKEDIFKIYNEKLPVVIRKMLAQNQNPYLEGFEEIGLELLRQCEIRYSQQICTFRWDMYSWQFPEIDQTKQEITREHLSKRSNFLTILSDDFEIIKEIKGIADIKWPDFQNPLEALKNLKVFIKQFGKINHNIKFYVFNDSLTQILLSLENDFFSKLYETDKKDFLKEIASITSFFVKQALRTDLRQSLAVQNTLALLLLRTYQCSKTLSNMTILEDFFPSFNKFLRDSLSPSFSVDNFKDWEIRQQIIEWIKFEETNKKKIFDFTFLKKNDEDFALRALEILRLKPRTSDQGQNLGETALLTLFNQKKHVLKDFITVLLYVEVCFNEKSLAQRGFEDKVEIVKGSWKLDLKNARISNIPFLKHPLSGSVNAADNRNLLLVRSEDQNATIKRFSNQLSADFLALEEAVSSPTLMISQVLNRILQNPSILKNIKVAKLLNEYLFKVAIVDANEVFPFFQEMKNHPKVLTSQIKKLLLHLEEEITDFIFPQKFDEDNLNYLLIILKTYKFSKEADCVELEDVLKSYLTKAFIKWNEAIEKNKMQISEAFWLCRFFKFYFLSEEVGVENEVGWVNYLEAGFDLINYSKNFTLQADKTIPSFLQEQIQQLQIQKVKQLQELIKDQKINSILNQFTENEAVEWDLTFYPVCKAGDATTIDLLQLTFGRGESMAIPGWVKNTIDFKRLFEGRVNSWTSNADGSFTIVDTVTYTVNINDELKQFAIIRNTANAEKLYYILEKDLDFLEMPPFCRQEGLWFFNQENKLICFTRARPFDPWIITNDQGYFKLVDSQEILGREIDVQDEDRPEKKLGIFGWNYTTLTGQKFKVLGSESTQFQLKKKIYPYIQYQGTPLELFYVPKKSYYEKAKFTTKDNWHLASESRTQFFEAFDNTMMRASFLSLQAIELYGLVLYNDNLSAVKTSVASKKIILPFLPHLSYAGARVVFAKEQNDVAESILLNPIETIVLPMSQEGFLPTTILETLFASYVLTLGKDHLSAISFLKSIPPNYNFTNKETTVLKWLINSNVDSGDFSSNAAAVRLYAYMLFLRQDLVLLGKVTKNEFPKTSLEAVYKDYLKDIQNISEKLLLSDNKELWLLEEGFNLVTTSKEVQSEIPHRIAFIKGKRVNFLVKHHAKKSSERIPILEKWKKEITLDLKEPLDVQESLIIGFTKPEPKQVLPGTPYPLERFSLDYLTLANKEASNEQKWKILFDVETAKISDWIKAALQHAYLTSLKDNENLIALPFLKEDFSVANQNQISNWFLSFTKESIRSEPLNRKFIVKKARSSFHKPFIEDQLNAFEPFPSTEMLDSRISKMETPYKYLTNIYKEVQKLFSTEESKKIINSPFFQGHYQNEWQLGLQYWNQSVITVENVSRLQDILKKMNIIAAESLEPVMFINGMHFHETENAKKILHHLLRTERITFEDLLRMVFYKKDEDKLKFLQKKNPFLTLKDIQFVNKLLIRHFDQQVAHETVKKIKQLDPELDAKEIITLLENVTKPVSKNKQERLETGLFEFLSGFRINEAQKKLLSELKDVLFKQGKGAFVFQQVMGAGKSTVILAHLASFASQENTVPIFLAHHSQYASAKSFLESTQYTKFHQRVIEIDYTKEDLASLSVLDLIYKKLQKAKANKRMVLMKASFLQVLSLERRNNLVRLYKDHLDQDLFIEERISLLSKIINFIDDEGLLIADEVDIILNILHEVYFPIGKPEVIQKDSLELIKFIYKVLSENPTLGLKQDKQTNIEESRLKNEIFNHLIDEWMDNYELIAEWLLLNNLEDKKEKLKNYILDKGPFTEIDKLKGSNDEFHHKILAAIGLMKKQIQEVLPVVLKKHYNQNYGFNDATSAKIIPFLGVDTPSTTEFGYIYLTASLFFQGGVQRGITKELLIDYKNKLLETAKQFATLYNISIENTAENRHFKNIMGISLIEDLSEARLEELIKSLSAEPETLIDFYAEYANLHLTYNASLLQEGSISLAKRGKKFVGCSGILWNKDTYAKRIREACQIEAGIEGRVMVRLAEQVSNGKSQIKTIKEDSPKSLLASFSSKDTRAIVDVSGLLRKYSNRQVAEDILQFADLEKEVNGVIYHGKIINKNGNWEVLEDEKQQGIIKDAFLYLPRGNEEIKILPNLDDKDLESMGIKNESTFFYYDDLRTIGTNAVLKKECNAILTFDPVKTAMRSLLQGLLRPRNFFTSQNVNIAISEEALPSMEGYDSKNPEDSLKYENIFQTAARNQDNILQKEQLLKAAIEEIKEIYKGCLERKLYLLEDPERKNFYDLIESLLLNTIKEDPAKFLEEKETIIEWELVKKFADHQKIKLEKALAILTDAEKEAIDQEVSEVLEWSKLKLTKDIQTSSSLEQGFSRDIEVTKEQEKFVEVEQEVEVDKESLKEVQKYQFKVESKPAAFISWMLNVEKPTSFPDYKAPTLLSMQDLLGKLNYEKDYAKAFPKDLLLTENLAKTYELDIPIFHADQKLFQHLLVYKENDSVKTLYLDLADASFWREQIYKNPDQNCYLLAIDGTNLLDRPQIPKEFNTQIERALFWGNLFNGNVNYLRSFPYLIKNELKNDNQAIKLDFLRLKTARLPAMAKIMVMDPSFTDNPVKPKTVFASKEEEQKWLQEKLKDLDEKKLNRLPNWYANDVPSQMIPMMKKRGFFYFLDKEKFQYVTPLQIDKNLVPNEALQYLTTKEQIEAVTPDKIFCLKGKALEYVKEENVKYIDFEEWTNLKKDFYEKYLDNYILEKGLNKFISHLTDEMIEFIPAKYVPNLEIRHIPYLKTADQLAQLSDDKLPFIDFSQIKLLSKDRYNVLPLTLFDENKNWDLLETSFIEEFFTNKAKDVIKKVPKIHKNYLSDPSLMIYMDRDLNETIFADKVLGILSTFFYPITLLVALFAYFAASKESAKKVLLTPLRLFSIINYLRISSID